LYTSRLFKKSRIYLNILIPFRHASRKKIGGEGGFISEKERKNTNKTHKRL